METSTDKKLLYSASETARQLGVSQRTLWSLTTPRGSLPCIRLGSRCMYSRRQLESWIAEQGAKGVTQ